MESPSYQNQPLMESKPSTGPVIRPAPKSRGAVLVRPGASVACANRRGPSGIRAGMGMTPATTRLPAGQPVELVEMVAGMMFGLDMTVPVVIPAPEPPPTTIPTPVMIATPAPIISAS